MTMHSTHLKTGIDLPAPDRFDLATQTNLIDECTQELTSQVAKIETMVNRIAGAVPREVPTTGTAKQMPSSPTNLLSQIEDIKNRLRWTLNDLSDHLSRLDSAIG